MKIHRSAKLDADVIGKAKMTSAMSETVSDRTKTLVGVSSDGWRAKTSSSTALATNEATPISKMKAPSNLKQITRIDMIKA